MTLDQISRTTELHDRLRQLRQQEVVVGFVPTMGALHRGHASLIERARAECGAVVVSIFVNPLQFDRQDDFDRYPRTLDADLEFCRTLGVDVVFAPAAEEMYPQQPLCTVTVRRLADFLCGRYRAGHFDGVATVVLKLFELVRPDRAYFGQKDAQQLAIIRRLVSDFNLPIEIVAVPTVREQDGLAVSSRNVRLSPRERQLAPFLYGALLDVSWQIDAGVRDAATVCRRAAARIPQNDLLRLEYLDVVDPDEMQPVTVIEAPIVAAGALWVGDIRLIDNLLCTPPPQS